VLGGMLSRVILSPGSMTKHFLLSLFLLAGLTLGGRAEPLGRETLDLSGQWRVTLEGPAPSFPMGDCPSLDFTRSIELPGTTETRGLGPLNKGAESGSLTRVRRFEGAVWYERIVEVSATLASRPLRLHLERTKHAQVWIDGKALGEQVLYTVPQDYPIPAGLVPGPHRLTIMVDNRLERRPVPAQAHQYSDDTQTNWNGLLGRLELVATDELSLSEIQAYPDLASHSLRLRIRLSAALGAAPAGNLEVRAESYNHAGSPHKPAALNLPLSKASLRDGAIELVYPLGADARTWDEFTPALYRLTVSLDSPRGRDQRVLSTGLREFKARGTQLTINGRVTFLRGKHDGCVFPLTGHPPMETEGWLAYLRTCQDYGINHLRCHTWVPPEAAFEAADQLGIYLQPELPFWGTFNEKVRDGLMPEAEALLREYGNHPSFVMMTLANEAGGDRAVMNGMVSHLRELDPRHLYADGSNNVLWEPRQQPTNDFWASAKVITAENGGKPLPARGSFCVFDGGDGHVQWGPSDTRTDLSKALRGVTVPFLGHETGQWTMYPDFRQISKYTGVVQARNLERFQRSLERHGMADLADEFATASGALAASLYREENELFLRSPGAAGFQLLDLQDYPGQGSALVGILDAFMDSKGVITPEEWRHSCSPIVALARFDRYTWTTDESYEADLELAHYGNEDLRGATTTWTITGADGLVFARGVFPVADIAQGGLRRLGSVKVALATASAPARYDLKVEVVSGQNRHTNNWPLWVYPSRIDTALPEGLHLARSLDKQAREKLAAGERVLLIPDSRNWADTVGGAYATDYWNWPMFNNTPGTLGLVCNPSNPALLSFPTRFHSERQWAAIAHASTPVILAEAPASLLPIVQVIDNYERNQKLGLVFEAKVGEGSLLVCACDLFALQNRPEARQLLSSLLDYAASPAFMPETELSPAQLNRILRPSLVQGRPVEASSFFHPPWGSIPEPARLVDGDINTKWIAADEDKAPVLSIALDGPHAVDSLELWWESDEAGFRYLAEGQTEDGKWVTLADERENTRAEGRHFLSFEPVRIKALRLSPTAVPSGRKFALRELRLLGD